MKGKRMSFNIAIDGPAGAGKSTIAKELAHRLSFIYVDTGAMYRAAAVYFLEHGISPDDAKAVESACGEVHISVDYADGEQQVYLNGENVNAKLRTEAVSEATSKVSAIGAVRDLLLAPQRNFAARYDIIMDGRDIGTNVLPNAQLKIYLTASVETRARRRYEESIKRGEQAELSEIAAKIESRDYRDMHRDIAPLKQAEDAVCVDTSDMDIAQVTDAILKLYQERAGV